MDLIKVVLEKDCLLFILGIFWLDIAQYIQVAITTCNPKIFGLLLAIITYVIVKTKWV